MVSWRDVWPLLVPGGLLVAGALVGYPFSLDAAVARERLLGLFVASAIAAGAALGLRRVERPRPWLVGAAVAAWLAGLWLVAASGPDVFRGTVGALLQVVFRPLFG